MNLSVLITVIIVGYILYYLYIMLPLRFMRRYKREEFKSLKPSSSVSLSRLKKTATQDDSAKKGDKFVEFVIRRFKKEYFTLLEWRSDKFLGDIYPLSNHLPDLEFKFRSSHKTIVFAIECKWRKSFFHDRITWAKDHQITNYNSYQQSKQIRVFIIIGVGGKPDSPKEMYIVPLSHVKYITVTREFLLSYKRYSPEKMFYLDADNITLR